MYTLTANQTLSKELVKAEQETDKFCNSLEVGKPRGRSEYFYDEGVIYRRRKNGEHQLVVPKKLVTDVIALNHDPIFAAHPGKKRTLEILCIRYFWPGMRQDVENYVRECDDCHRIKQGREYTAPLGDVRQPIRAYRGTPHGTSEYSPYYLLHGREMILPTSHDLRAKLTPDVRETEYVHRLEHLKSTLKSTYKMVRENSQVARDQ